MSDDRGDDRQNSFDHVCRTLAELEARLAELRYAAGHAQAPAASDKTALHVAKRMYHERRLRDRAFTGYDLFGEPAWDLLLDLFIAGEERRKIGISSACIAAVVPPTTALRWIITLREQGLISRGADPDDGRRSLLTLTPRAHRLMIQLLGERR